MKNPKSHVGLLSFIKACFDYTQIYPMENPTVLKQFEYLIRICDELIKEKGALTIEHKQNFIIINGRCIEAEDTIQSAIDWFKAHCYDRKITELVINRGIDRRELVQLIQLFKTDFRLFVDDTVAMKILLPAGVEHIQINPANLDDSFSLATSFDEALKIAPKGQSRKNSPYEPGLHISKQTGDLLRDEVIRYIDGGEIWRVAEVLASIRGRFDTQLSEIRRISFSRYRVVVEVLIERQLNEVVYSILKSMPNDFNLIKENTEMDIHVTTLGSILEYFRLKRNFRPLVFGLFALASQVRRVDVESENVKARLIKVVEPELLNDLFKARSGDMNLNANLTKLFRNYSRELSFPLIHYLCRTEDKHHRKMLLNVLGAMGTSAFPELIKRLENAVEREEEWFIKRNLLTLLSTKPSSELAPILWQLSESETNEKVIDLVAKCQFALTDARSVELAQGLLVGEEIDVLVKRIGYVGKSGNSRHVERLIEMNREHSHEKITAATLNALARVGTDRATEYVASLLKDVSFFKKITKGGKRGLAAMALAKSGNEAHIHILKGFVDDKDDRVREIAAKAVASVDI